MNRPKNDRNRRRRLRRQKNEGAAMLVTMLVLLSTTALAVFAVHSTTFEIRAAGHARQGMQSQYLGETGLNASMAFVDSQGPRALLWAMEQESASGIDVPLAPLEPNLADNKQGYRIYPADIPSTTALADPESLGAVGPGGMAAPRQPYEPYFVVDVNDHYRAVLPIAGERADGHGRLEYLHATYTSRGRLRLTVGTEPYEAASDGRAYGLTGPYGG